MSTRPPTAGPSTTTPPTIPRNPVRLSVAQRSSSIASSSSTNAQSTNVDEDGPSVNAEDDTLIRAAVRKAKLQRRVDKYMDRLMEETVDRETFKRIASHLTPSQYLEVTHERHLNSLCSYPLCSNPPKREYSIAKRFVISTSKRTIKETEGNEEDGFCSVRCKVRSEWVERNLSGEAIWLRDLTNLGAFELLEELEERGEFAWGEGEGGKKKSATINKMGYDRISQNRGVRSTASSRSRISETTSPSKTDTVAASNESQRSSSPTPKSSSLNTGPQAPSSSQPENPVSTLIANLTIHERPTPSTPPIAPSLSKPQLPTPSSPSSPSTPQPQPKLHPQAQVQPPSQNRTPSKGSVEQSTTSPRDSRRTQNSLIGPSTSGLSNTFVSASKHLAGMAENQVSDDEEEKEESDWEKEMGWGDPEDEEMKGIWEEARLAQELVDEEDGKENAQEGS